MKATIYCRPTQQGIHSFYLRTTDGDFYLFSQNYRKGVQDYFGHGVRLEQARDFSRSRKDTAIIKTMDKLPMYIKYIEKEYGIVVLNQTKRKNTRHICHEKMFCA